MTRGMSDETWTPSRQWMHPITPHDAAIRLGMACAALDKIARYTESDEAKYGSPGDFAKTALEIVMVHTSTAERRLEP